MPDLITVAFAQNGDKIQPPLTSPTNFVSFNSGYTQDYEISLDIGNPNAKAVERGIQNYLFGVTTDNISFLQAHGYCIWYNTMPGGYGLNDKVVRQNSSGTWLPYRSLVTANISDPLTNPSSWEFDYSVTAINAAIPMPSGGSIGAATALIAAPTDLNTLSKGTFEIVNDAVAITCGNIPVSPGASAVAGMVEMMQWIYSAVNYSIQRYTARSGFTASRGSINGVWSSWVLTSAAYGRSDGAIVLSSPAVLNATAGGNLILWSGAAGYISIPVKSSLITNQFLWFYNDGTGPVNIMTQTPDVIVTNAGNLNTITLQVGDSLQIAVLSSSNSYQIVGGTGSLQFSNTTTSQPPVGDNSQRIATTAFVINSAGNTNGVYNFSGTATLTQQHIGGLLIFAAGTYTINLPNPALVPGGIIRTILNGAGAVTLNSFAGTSIIYPNGVTGSSQVLYSGDEREYYSDGVNWFSSLSIINSVYPVGIVTFFAQNKNPNTLFPGTTWNYIGENRTIRLGLQNGSDVRTTGGADTVTIVRSYLPNFSLNLSGSVGSTDLGSPSTNGAGGHSHGGVPLRQQIGISGDTASIFNPRGLGNTDAVGDHSHSINLGAHSHSLSGATTESLGSGVAMPITNAYVKLMGWYRSA